MRIQAIADQLRTAKRVLFITGAGISQDSGVPTYRGVGGLYEDRDVESGLRIEEILSGTMFARNPALTWRYIAEIEAACRNAAPNLAHTTIAELETPDRTVWVLTQNVDGLHQRAGSSNVIDIHGHVYTLFCPAEACTFRKHVQSYVDLAIPPCCPTCHTIIRPDVVLFEELLPETRIRTLARELETGFDMVFSIGTSSLFPYIVGPVLEAAKAGVPTVEINPSTTSISGIVNHHVEMRAAAAMKEIRAAL